MKVVHAKQVFPEVWSSAIMLCGPTPRGAATPSWRPEAVHLLEEVGYDGVVFVPEPEDGLWQDSDSAYSDQVEWEHQALEFADIILFWIPRDQAMPGFATNVEFGRYVTSGKVVLGAPIDAVKIDYLSALLARDADSIRHMTLRETIDACVRQIAVFGPRIRSGGERKIPLHIWSLPSFQAWYTALVGAGNRMDDACVEWHDGDFAWILRVRIWVSAEDRYKENEYVVGRTDIATTCIYWHPPGSTDILDTEVVLVREFRPAVRNPAGMVTELPGGSSHHHESDMLRVATNEVYEETGVIIASHRFKPVGSRQVFATLCTHHAHLFGVESTASEIAQCKALERASTASGFEPDSERTYLRVRTLRDIIGDPNVDWSTIGMIAQAITKHRG